MLRSVVVVAKPSLNSDAHCIPFRCSQLWNEAGAICRFKTSFIADRRMNVKYTRFIFGYRSIPRPFQTGCVRYLLPN